MPCETSSFVLEQQPVSQLWVEVICTLRSIFYQLETFYFVFLQKNTDKPKSVIRPTFIPFTVSP